MDDDEVCMYAKADDRFRVNNGARARSILFFVFNFCIHKIIGMHAWRTNS